MLQVVSSNIDPEIVEKKKEYMNYIDEHKRNVLIAYNKIIDKIHVGIVVDGKNVFDIIDQLSIDIGQHDKSKYSEAEFDAYRRKFYPTTLESKETDEAVLKEVEERFEKAWENHYMINDHHPKYWCYWNTNKNFEPKDMNLKAIIHMICDWEAMSIKFNGYTIDWWIHKAIDERKCMTKNTIKVVEELLRTIYDYDGEFNYDE